MKVLFFCHSFFFLMKIYDFDMPPIFCLVILLHSFPFISVHILQSTNISEMFKK